MLMGGAESLCRAGRGSVCVPVLGGHWLGLSDKNKSLLCLGISQRRNVLSAVLCSVKIPKLEMSSKVVQQHSWSLFSVYFRSSRIPPLPDSS